jgi:(p)ppGpp synthase/HD superfamily hydrolase
MSLHPNADKLVIAARYFLAGGNYTNAQRALELVVSTLDGQVRNDGRPAIIHQISMFHHLRSFRDTIGSFVLNGSFVSANQNSIDVDAWDFDCLAAAILLHDMQEDFPDIWAANSFKFDEPVSMLVHLLSKPAAKVEFPVYIESILQHSAAAPAYMLKLIDRINNMSTAPGTFKADRLQRYLDESEYMIKQVKRVRRTVPALEGVFDALKINLIHLVDIGHTVLKLRQNEN